VYTACEEEAEAADGTMASVCGSSEAGYLEKWAVSFRGKRGFGWVEEKMGIT